MVSGFCRIARFSSVFALAAIGGLATCSPAAAGVIIGVESHFATPTGPFFGNDVQADTVAIGSLASPIPIFPKIGAAAWPKEIVINRDGQGWSTSGPDSMFNVVEALSINGLDPINPLAPPRVIDWHVDIDQTFGDGANFKLVGGKLRIPGPIGVVPGPYTAAVSGDGKSLWFDFPPLPIVPIEITQQLMWAGSGPVTPGPVGTNTYRIRLLQRPSIPEPTTAMLLGLAIGGAAIVSRRHRNR